MYELTIRPVLNGWIIQVGCQELVFSDRVLMFSQVDEYLQQPDVVEKQFREKSVNAKILLKPAEVGISECVEVAPRQFH